MSETADLDDAVNLITGSEAGEILRICGKSQVEFARFIEKSAQFVRGEKILGAPRYVRLQWVRALRAFVSEQDYLTALSVIRSRNQQRKGRAR